MARFHGKRGAVAAFTLLLAGAAGAAWLLWKPRPGDLPPGSASRERPSPALDEPALRKLCSHCHLFPEPDSLPRAAWRKVIADMAGLPGYASNVPRPPGQAALVEWYEQRAPAEFSFPAVPTEIDPGPLSLRPIGLSPLDAESDPFVSHVKFADVLDDPGLELVVCEMRHGRVLLGRPASGSTVLEPIAEVPHPAHAEAVDLNGDGLVDLVVANLGSFLPLDHNLGSVEWLRQTAPGRFERITLLDGLGRVADVQPVDFDGDGDIDLIVSEFGWRATGRVLVLENVTTDWSRPAFTAQYIDSRSGAIHTTAADLDGDGRLDLVGLLAQEHEAVVAWRHRGEYGFDIRELYRGPNPSWGSSGMQLVDLNQNGRLDVLVTNGDTLDDGRIKPYHGIQWLENRGDLTFVPHPLAVMYGVHRAEAVDLDGDGDLDIVACAFTDWQPEATPAGRIASPSEGQPDTPGRTGSPSYAAGRGDATAADPSATIELVSLLWLEQTAPGQFRRWNLAGGPCRHPTLSAADFDGDGDIDFAVGNATPLGEPVSSWVVLWENLRSGSP